MSDSTASTGSGQVVEQSGDSPGRRLREARTQRKISIDRVAKELHLDASVIHAIENDDRAAMPPPAFVQGYIRGYARLMELPEDELVRQFVAQGGEPPPLSVIGVGNAGKVPMLRLPSMRLLRNLILVMLALIMVWLAWPVAERMLESRPVETDEPVPGRLELPPPE
jgi:cytoskeleton protein RodZ